MNGISIAFAQGGFILSVSTDDETRNEVFVSQGKLIKAVRAAIDELSLLPKKSDEEAGSGE